MRMIDGKPEYKNGLVRKWAGGLGGLGLENGMLWEGGEGRGEDGRSPGSQVLAPAPCPPV